MSERAKSYENRFIADTLQVFFDEAKRAIAPHYLKEEAGRFSDFVVLDFLPPHERGEEIPSIRYEGRTNKMHLRVNSQSLLEYAIFLSQGTELGVPAVTKALIGAGVARSVMGWKILPLRFTDNEEKRYKLLEQLCTKEPLLRATTQFDNLYGTNLTGDVFRLGDDQMTEINVLRFAVGASLGHTPEVMGWPPKWTTVVGEELVADERQRALDLRSALAVLEPDSAFTLYDQRFPTLLVALNFPMTPEEELTNFASESF